VGRCELGSSDSEKLSGAGSSERINETSGSIKGGEFLD
jgi:hypothetical protein